MKKVFSILAVVLLTTNVFAQSPQKMSYQAVVRDGNNNLVTSTAVGMQISILQGSVYGAAVYVETHTPTTNANGLVSLEIGTGTVLHGNFSAINWANGPYFIKTETDPTGGTNYTITGINQLLSVPYALYAKTAESATETDPVFTASPSFGITSENITNWTAAHTHSTATTGSVHGSTTLGGNLLRLNNPSEISFLRVNADNSVSALNTADFRSAIGAGTGNGTITSITTQNGITGGPITTTGTIILP